MKHPTPTLFAVAASAAVAAGCSEGSSSPSGTVGDMGYGVFSYACVDEGDAACNEGTAVDANVVEPDLGVDGQLPVALAVGGRFDLHYYGEAPYTDQGYGLPVEVVPVLPELVRSVGGFSFQEPGTVAFLVRSPQGVVVDFIHLTAASAGALELWWNEQQVGSFAIESPGLETTAAVVPTDGDGIHLAGALPYHWESSDPTVVRLAALGSAGVPPPDGVISDDEVRIVAMAEGHATLTVQLEGLVSEVDVTVGPEEMP